MSLDLAIIDDDGIIIDGMAVGGGGVGGDVAVDGCQLVRRGSYRPFFRDGALLYCRCVLRGAWGGRLQRGSRSVALRRGALGKAAEKPAWKVWQEED